MKLNALFGLTNLAMQVCQYLFSYAKNRPIFTIDGWSFDPVQREVTIHLNNQNSAYFSITKIKCVKTSNIGYIGKSLPIYVNNGDEVKLTFRYIGDVQPIDKDKFCFSLQIRDKVGCKYNYKLKYENNRSYIDY